MQHTRHLYLLKIILFTSDIFIISLSLFLSFSIIETSGFSNDLINRKLIIMASLIWLLIINTTGLYDNTKILKIKSFCEVTLVSLSVQILLLGLYFFISYRPFPLSIFYAFFCLIATSFILSRAIIICLVKFFNNRHLLQRSVAILGRSKGATKFASYLQEQQNLHFHGFLDENTDNIFSVAAQYGIKDVYLSLSLIEIKNINNLMSEAENQCVRLKLVPDFNSASSYNVNSMANFTVITHRKDPLETLPNRFKKRLFDIALSSIVIIFILSWLFPILAILIKIQNPGPILLKQIRCGRNNKPFMCFSFRSIKINVENKTKQAAIGCYNVDAPAVGKFIRRTGLDKFPQFLNVLAGNMSIVGPKPHSIKHTEIYGAIEEQFMVRQFLKPGIIGWAQLKEFRGETNQKSLIKKRIGHDIWYMERWSELLDLKIIWCTIASRIQIKRKAMKTRKPTEYVTA